MVTRAAITSKDALHLSVAWAQPIGLNWQDWASKLSVNLRQLEDAVNRTWLEAIKGDGDGGGGGSVDWADITNKPTNIAYKPIAQADVTNLTTDLAGKEPAITPGNPAYFWAGDKTWKPVAGGGAALVSISDTPPSSPTAGSLWYESDSGTLFIRVDDGSSQQYVDVSGNTQGGGGGGGSGSGFLAFPAGCTFDYWGPTAPAGTLFCAGQAVSRTTYSTLFAVLGTTYGSGDGSTTFNLPDLRGRVTVAKDNMGGTAANRVTSAGSGVDASTLGAVGGSERLHGHAHGIIDAGHTHPVNDPGHIHGITDPGHDHGYIGGQNAIGSGTAGPGLQSGSTVNKTVQSDNTGITVNSRFTGISITSRTTGVTVNSTGAGASENMPPSIVCNKIMTTGGV